MLAELGNILEIFIRTHEQILKVTSFILTLIIIILCTIYDAYIKKRQKKSGGRLIIWVDFIFAIFGMMVVPLLLGFIEKDYASIQKALEQERAYTEAMQLCEEKEYEQAKYIWDGLINEEPDNPRFHFEYSKTLFNMKNYEEALAQAKEAVSLTADNAEYQNQVGRAYGELGDYELAFECFCKAIELEADIFKFYKNAGYALQKSERFEEACEYYETAIELLDKKTEENKMEKSLINQRYGLALDGLGEYSRALIQFEKAYELNTENTLALKWIDVENARIDVLENQKDAFYINELGARLYNVGEYNEAYENFEMAINFSPEDANLYFNACNAKYNLEEYDNAIVMIEKAMELNPEDIRYLQTKKLIEAKRDLVLDPEDQNKIIRAGYAEYELGYYSAAKNVFQKGLELYPEDKIFKDYLELIVRQEEYDKDNESVEKAGQLGFALYNLELYEKSKEIYHWLISKEKNNANYHNMLGCVYYGIGEFENAYKSFRTALELVDKDSENWTIFSDNLKLADEKLQ